MSTDIESQKCGIVGFTKTIAREGAKYNIVVNAVAPSAGTNMTRTVRPEEEVQAMKPDFVAPLVAALCSDKPPASGQLYEAGTGSFMATRWQRTRGVDFDVDDGVPSVEAVGKAFAEICNFDNGQADNPENPQEGSRYTMGNVLKNPKFVRLSKSTVKETTANKPSRPRSSSKKTGQTGSTCRKLMQHSNSKAPRPHTSTQIETSSCTISASVQNAQIYHSSSKAPTTSWSSLHLV